eukprot:CAMPEP_0184327538 /NCGR_PEP_ID=MMETSP1049-20130417/143145_1 /TAXON_ID=77928 /ORGANISM="Proteomonas sulcata, Strain CCMP704" /LENGTH=61 /DNA_ID=CAMNT_0026649799 /DNA_START=767 /DNA_END=953 /DNA_ORIENTATION=+
MIPRFLRSPVVTVDDGTAAEPLGWVDASSPQQRVLCLAALEGLSAGAGHEAEELRSWGPGV